MPPYSDTPPKPIEIEDIQEVLGGNDNKKDMHHFGRIDPNRRWTDYALFPAQNRRMNAIAVGDYLDPTRCAFVGYGDPHAIDSTLRVWIDKYHWKPLPNPANSDRLGQFVKGFASKFSNPDWLISEDAKVWPRAGDNFEWTARCCAAQRILILTNMAESSAQQMTQFLRSVDGDHAVQNFHRTGMHSWLVRYSRWSDGANDLSKTHMDRLNWQRDWNTNWLDEQIRDDFNMAWGVFPDWEPPRFLKALRRRRVFLEH
jgi:hypothetical protein